MQHCTLYQQLEGQRMDIAGRVWDLYQQLEAQRAVLQSYQESLLFVRASQTGQLIEPIGKALWGIAEGMRGDARGG